MTIATKTCIYEKRAGLRCAPPNLPSSIQPVCRTRPRQLTSLVDSGMINSLVPSPLLEIHIEPHQGAEADYISAQLEQF